jgi:hypothetical protein
VFVAAARLILMLSTVSEYHGVIGIPEFVDIDLAMTSSELKQEILRTLSDLVEQCREVRFGQLIVKLSCIARGPLPQAMWDMEDDEPLAATKSHLEDFERRNAGIAQSSS